MKFRRLVALLATGVVVAACGQGGSTTTSSGSGPKHGAILHVAIGIDPDTLDPAAQTTTTASQIVDMMAERLYTMDSNGQTVHQLAVKDADVATDGLTYTVTLRTGNKVSDGTPFNEPAVTWSIARLTDKGFGFISIDGQEKDLFFHSNELVGVSFDDLREGDKVTFEVADGPKGKSATKVSKV